jgi:hypothetical protein
MEQFESLEAFQIAYHELNKWFDEYFKKDASQLPN